MLATDEATNQPQTEEQERTCSREDSGKVCGKPLDTAGYPRWCKACRSAYKSQYATLQKEMQETRGFSAGISAMRECAADMFGEYGSGQFSGYEVAGMIRQMPGPIKPASKS